MSKADASKPKTSLKCAVLTISDTRTSANDTSGDYLSASIAAEGHECVARALCAGNLYQIRKIISDWIANEDIQVIVTNGGTGFTHQKATGAAITPLLDMVIAGFGDRKSTRLNSSH